MKLKLLLAFLFVTISFTKTFAQDSSEALQYLEFLSEQNQNITEQVWKYTKAVAHDKRPKKIEKTRMKLVAQIRESKNLVQKRPSVTNDDTYKNQFIEYLTIYENTMNNDYAKIVDMKEIAEQSYDAMEAYILMQQKVDEKLENASSTIQASKKEFADKHNINLIEGGETELAKKMKISNEVFDYKNQAYLPFFKANFQESVLVQSLGSNNVGEIQQKSAALLSFVEEGLDSIKAMPAYKNDKSVLIATENILLFYKDEASTKVPAMIDFMLLNDKITKMSKALESKKPKNRTKEEIDEYNALVKTVNEEVAKFNKTNEQLNQQRAQLLTQWENATNNFLSKHIPKN